MSKRNFSIMTVFFLLVLVGGQSLFTVHETERALILQLGKPVSGVQLPGLHAKLPFVQNVLYFDARILNYEAQATDLITSDKKAIVIDNYARWRISDPLTFYRTMITISSAQLKLKDIIYSQLQAIVGQYTLTQIVSSKRQEIMDIVKGNTNALLNIYGIDVVDVQIKRTDLPKENELAIFHRMKAERERQATQYRSEGQEEAARVRSNADRERSIIVADAQLQGELIRAEADAVATRVFGEAVSQDPAFYEFIRSMQAYKTALKERTRLVLSPDDDAFLRFLRRP